MKWGGVFQLSALLFMAQQALIAPKVLGMNNFGLQILFLSPMFLAQSLFEPILQLHLNRQAIPNSGKVNVSIKLLSLAVLFSFGVVFTAQIVMASGLILLTTGFLIIYLAQTLFSSVAFRQGNIKASALAMGIIATTFTPLLLLFFSYYPDFALILTLMTTFLFSSVFLGLQMRTLGQITFISKKLELGEIISALLFRIPLITINTLTIILLGVLSTPGDTIGRARILLSLGGAVRFFNALPLPRLQVLISEAKIQGFRKIAPELKLYARSFVMATALVSIVAPFALSWYYTPNYFSVIEVLLFCTISLLQPAGYLFVLLNEGHPVRQLLLILSITSVSLLTFWILLASGESATISIGYSSLLCLALLALRLIHRKRKPSE